MFLKSFKILIGAMLLVLAAIVAYAALQLSGPEEALAEAQGLLQRREYNSALNVLNLTEPSVEGDPARRARLLRLRYAANTELGNPAGALQDVDALLRDQPADVALRLDRIRLLALAGDGPGARLAAMAFLTDHPDHGRGLELAGEACQTVYQPQLRDLRSRIDHDLSVAERAAARDAMLSFLYRPDGDPEVQHAGAALQRAYTGATRLQAAWEPLWQDLQRARTAVQEGLDYFERSLAADGKPVAAFRAIAWAYDQSGRADDLLMACEIQRRRFDHEYVAEAGATAAWSLLRDGLTEAARATADRWLPKGSIERLLAKNWSEVGTNELLLANAYAAWLQRDADAIASVWNDANTLVQAKRPVGRTLPFAAAMMNRALGNKEYVLPCMRWAGDAILRAPTPLGQLDLAPVLLTEWLQVIDEGGVDLATTQTILRNWVNGRPEDAQPQLAFAEFLARTGRPAAALTAFDAALRLAPDEEQLLSRRLEVARAHHADSALSGPSLLAQCLRLGLLAPEVADPVGSLLCAEEAIAQRVWPVAIASARAAVDGMPGVRAAREAEVRAHLGAGRAVDAARLARRLLELFPADATGVQLAFAAHRAADLPTHDLLVRAMTCGTPTPELQIAMLRATAEAEPSLGAAFATPFARQANNPPELRILAARALARAGQAEPAQPDLVALLDLAAELPPRERSDLLQAWVLYCQAAAGQTTDAALAPPLEQALAAIGEVAADDTSVLLAAAKELAASHPRTAYAMFTAALPAVPRDRRDASLFQLGGQLAARLCAWRACEEHLTAALGFPDGQRSAEQLVRLCVAQGRSDRGARIALLTTQPTDAALAGLLDHWDLAQALLGTEVRRDSADLLAHGLMALCDLPSLVDWVPAKGAAAQDRLELLTILHDPSLAPLALPRLEALVASQPEGRANRLLLARGLLHAGQPARAAALHARLHAEGASNVMLWREAALATEVPGYTIDPALQRQILAESLSPTLAGSPPTSAYALRCLADQLDAAGSNAAADDLRLRLLASVPPARALTDAELALLERSLPPTEVWRALERLLQSPYPIDRDDLLARLHAVAPRAMTADPAAAPTVLAAAWNHLETDGAHGCIVHFLLHHDERLRKQTSRRADLLRAHLQRLTLGNEGARWLPETVAALMATVGADTTLLELDAARRQQPMLLGLWVERTRLLLASRDAHRSIDELRAVLHHADDPAMLCEYLALAAEARHLAGDEATQFARLPNAIREAPAGAHVAAMLALRRGDAEAALAAFARAAPRGDGMHLFGAALAWLQSPAADGGERAAALLQQLARDYPSSSVAGNAGSFARQLGPR